MDLHSSRTTQLTSADASERPAALAAESVILLERLLADARGRFLLERAIAELGRQPTIESSFSKFFGFNHMPNDGADLTKVERLAAAIDSSNYLNGFMSDCKRYANSEELLAAGMQARSVPDGLILEFGVYSGRSVNYLATLQSGRVFGFDSFEGLPEDWRPDTLKSAFKVDKLPAVADNVELVVGWFEDTLPGFLEAHPGPVTFLHVDCDLYSSTRTVFHYLRDRIVPGTVIIFDEYFNYIGWRNHEYKAFAEFVTECGLKYRYIGAVPTHQQVGVVIL
jgi:predicted O-methyltransferase YrrM